MSKSAQAENTVHVRRFPGLGPVEWMRARYRNQIFTRHFHERYALGIIEHGALGFRYRGEEVTAAAGAVGLVIPGEPHNGYAASEQGWSYRMLYLGPELLQQAAEELKGKPAGMPFFRAGALEDEVLAAGIRDLHLRMEDEAMPRLEKETRLLDLLTFWIRRHAEERPEPKDVGREPGAVDRVRELMHADFAQELSLETLAGEAALSPYHFVRVFRSHVGMPPHAYLIQVRIRKARELLAAGKTPAEAAQETGFSDQSHLTNHFKRFTGVTPARYRKIILQAS